MKNWAENVQWNPAEILKPSNEAELIEMIKRANENNKKIRLIGSGHSFTPLCETNQWTMSLDNMQGVIDREGNIVKLHAGTKLFRIGDELEKLNLSQENLGDINKQSIAGAISTGTHGTGIEFGSIATQIEEITFINGKAEKVVVSENDVDNRLFRAAQLSLGSLGVITEVKVKCSDAFNLELDIRKEKLEDVLANLESILEDNRHFEFYLIPQTNWVQSRYSNKVADAATYTSKFAAFVNDIVLENWALQLLCEVNRIFPKSAKGVSKTLARFISNEKKVQKSHRVFSTVRNVKFQEMEYNVPYENYPFVIKELKKMLDKNDYRISFPLEHRFVRKDNILLSPANGRNSAYIACHVYKGMSEKRYFGDLEKLFVEHDGRPHWGKMHTRDAAFFASVYPEFELFNTLRKSNDPNGVFSSPYIERVLGE